MYKKGLSSFEHYFITWTLSSHLDTCFEEKEPVLRACAYSSDVQKWAILFWLRSFQMLTLYTNVISRNIGVNEAPFILQARSLVRRILECRISEHFRVFCLNGSGTSKVAITGSPQQWLIAGCTKSSLRPSSIQNTFLTTQNSLTLPLFPPYRES